MEITMTFKHLDSTEAIKMFAQEKTKRLARYFQGRVSITWSFSVEKQGQIAHVHLVGNHMDYFGEAATENLYRSIEGALTKIERQLKRHKEKTTNHLHLHQAAS